MFKKDVQALLIKVASVELAEMAVNDRVLRKFCKQVDANTLVIPANKERALRKRLKQLEYVLAL